MKKSMMMIAMVSAFGMTAAGYAAQPEPKSGQRFRGVSARFVPESQQYAGSTHTTQRYIDRSAIRRAASWTLFRTD